jgi:hypothetical protein
MGKERIREAVEAVRKQKATPGETEGIAKARIERIGPERQVGSEGSSELAAHSVPRLPIGCCATPRKRQPHDLAMDKGGACREWQLAAAAAGSLFKLRTTPAEMMPKHVPKGLPYGVAERAPREGSAAKLATAMTTAAVLCTKGRRKKEREGNRKQKTDMATYGRPPANQVSTPPGCRFGRQEG